MRHLSATLLPVVIISALGWHGVQAKVSDSEAAQLKTVLTPLGAERAGNADGTIPAWTGGMTSLPPGVDPNGRMPDFYKNDKILFTIDAGNVDKYAAKLSPGTIYLLKNYPGYKIDIYPTHRPEAAPQWFYDATFKNATAAELKDENWIINAKGGIPFPIPKTGKEAIWNLNLSWHGVQSVGTIGGYIVAPNSTPQLEGTATDAQYHPYADMNYNSGSRVAYYLLARESQIRPPNRVGEEILAYVTYNQEIAPLITWQYLVGQRRLRKAPQVTYDGAFPDCGGIISIDETSLFNGPPDRYNVKLLGKREMYIPYDNNGIKFAPSADLLGRNFLNPKYVRWELHRVWTVELTLAPGKHHLLPHRVDYLDEDSWFSMLSEDYYASGELKVGQAFNETVPTFPGTFATGNVFYNTKGSGYCLAGAVTADHPTDKPIAPPTAPLPLSYFSPATVAAEAVR